jgi:cell division protein FtsB
MRPLLIVLALMLTGLQYRLWVGEGSFADIVALNSQIATQQIANDVLRQRNQRLETQVAEFKEGLDSVEEHARNQLGMIRKGESFFLLLGE